MKSKVKEENFKCRIQFKFEVFCNLRGIWLFNVLLHKYMKLFEDDNQKPLFLREII